MTDSKKIILLLRRVRVLLIWILVMAILQTCMLADLPSHLPY